MVHITIFAALSDYFVTIVAMRIWVVLGSWPWNNFVSLALKKVWTLALENFYAIGLGHKVRDNKTVNYLS